MTIIIQQDGVFYTDSRRSSRDGVVTENVVKITTFDVREKVTWGGLPILAVAGAGQADDINKVVNLLRDSGEEAYEGLRVASRHSLITNLSVTLGVLTATHYYVIDIRPSRGHGRLPAPAKHERKKRTAFGSGRLASNLALRWFKSDCVGQICGAIALADGTCGGYVLKYDTNDRTPKMVSRHYRYPKVRMVVGGLLQQYDSLNRWLGKLLFGGTGGFY